MLESVEWGEFRIEDVLEWQNGITEINPLHLDILHDAQAELYPFYGQAVKDNGIISYNRLTSSVLNNPQAKPTLLIHSNNQNIVYLETPFYLKDGHGATSVLQAEWLNKRNALYLAATIEKVIAQKFSYQNKATKIALKNTKIQLPTQNGELALDFMENFVAELEVRRTAELEAYLSAAGLKDCTLTAAEQNALADLEQGRVVFAPFTFDSIFNQIHQGRRLKKDDQQAGSIPFVMAGVTNTGVVGYIANPVARFPKNAITLDIFGNAFYRSYDFGAGDDTGVYWHDKQDFSKEIMLFLTAAMQKSVMGKFSYGKKLRSSQSLKIQMRLPEKDGQPDYVYMQTLLSAVQKIVIKDVVQYADRKIAATKTVIGQAQNKEKP